jgi:ATP/maltotriose-dependent transcriptional regulator MalT
MRPRLFAPLDRGASGSVTLVAAPAGSGKTMLLSLWLRTRNLPGSVAWVSVGRDELWTARRTRVSAGVDASAAYAAWR